MDKIVSDKDALLTSRRLFILRCFNLFLPEKIVFSRVVTFIFSLQFCNCDGYGNRRVCIRINSSAWSMAMMCLWLKVRVGFRYNGCLDLNVSVFTKGFESLRQNWSGPKPNLVPAGQRLNEFIDVCLGNRISICSYISAKFLLHMQKVSFEVTCGIDE